MKYYWKIKRRQRTYLGSIGRLGCRAHANLTGPKNKKKIHMVDLAATNNGDDLKQ
jgi:hypothetical protein